MQKVIALLLVVVGIIHLLPLSGVLGAERLAALYGLDFSVVSFLAIALSMGCYNEAIRKVVLADWVALAALAGAGMCLWLLRRG